MNPRKPLILWQHFAQAFGRVQSGFAPLPGLSQSAETGFAAVRGFVPACDPFPTLWPSPFGVGSFFALIGRAAPDQHKLADGPVHGIFPFVSGKIALESVSITTKHRGKTSCRKPSLFFFWSQPRWPAVCKTPRRAALQALLPVWRLLTIRTPTCWAARLSAGLQALRPVRCRAKWVAKTPASDRLDLTATAAGHICTPAIQGVRPLGWLFHFARPVARPI